MKKDADEAKKAAAELTARLEALEVEAKAKEEVSKVQRSEQSKVPFYFVTSPSSGQVLGNGCMSHKYLFRLETVTGAIIVPPLLP